MHKHTKDANKTSKFASPDVGTKDVKLVFEYLLKIYWFIRFLSIPTKFYRNQQVCLAPIRMFASFGLYIKATSSSKIGRN